MQNKLCLSGIKRGTTCEREGIGYNVKTAKNIHQFEFNDTSQNVPGCTLKIFFFAAFTS